MKYLNIILAVVSLVLAVINIIDGNFAAFCGWICSSMANARIIMIEYQNK